MRSTRRGLFGLLMGGTALAALPASPRGTPEVAPEVDGEIVHFIPAAPVDGQSGWGLQEVGRTPLTRSAYLNACRENMLLWEQMQ